jgi:hypothetical protein
MVQLDSSLRLTAAPSVMHRQRALQAANQIVSAYGRTQEDTDRPLAKDTAARVLSESAVPLCLRRFIWAERTCRYRRLGSVAVSRRRPREQNCRLKRLAKIVIE